jgi:Ca2+-binding EF-hand superfamily protein
MLAEWRREQARILHAREDPAENPYVPDPFRSEEGTLRPLQDGGRRRLGEPARHTKRRNRLRDRPRNMHLMENLDEMSAYLRDEIAGRWSTVRNIFVQCDIDGSGMIDRREWCLALPLALNMVGQIKEQDASNLFDHFDADGNGELDYHELYMMLRQGARVELDSRLKAGAVEFDREATQRHKTRKQARTTKGSNTLHGLVLGGGGDGGDGGGGDAPPMDPADVLNELGKALATKLGRIVDLFREWDLDGSGEIDKREFCDAMESVGLDWSEEKRGALFDQLDDDKSGCIEYRELTRKLRRAANAAERKGRRNRGPKRVAAGSVRHLRHSASSPGVRSRMPLADVDCDLSTLEI